MEKEEVICNPKFRKICEVYGLNMEDFEIYKDVIVLNTSSQQLFVLLDHQYNIMAVHKITAANALLTMKERIDGYLELYELVDQENGFSFPFPFQEFSLKQMIELSNRTGLCHLDGKKNRDMLVNGKLVMEAQNQDYIGLLCYIKFLGEQIQQYFFQAYQMKLMGYDYPDVYQYIRNLMDGFQEAIDHINLSKQLEKGEIEFTDMISSMIGSKEQDIEKNSDWLCQLFAAIMKKTNIKIESYPQIRQYIIYCCTKQDRIQSGHFQEPARDLSILARNLLKILELPEEYPTGIISSSIDLKIVLEEKEPVMRKR